eukprot:scaffold38473_cov18-Tisochrysis_lutea.AAC.1
MDSHLAPIGQQQTHPTRVHMSTQKKAEAPGDWVVQPMTHTCTNARRPQTCGKWASSSAAVAGASKDTSCGACARTVVLTRSTVAEGAGGMADMNLELYGDKIAAVLQNQSKKVMADMNLEFYGNGNIAKSVQTVTVGMDPEFYGDGIVEALQNQPKKVW